MRCRAIRILVVKFGRQNAMLPLECLVSRQPVSSPSQGVISAHVLSNGGRKSVTPHDANVMSTAGKI